MAQNANEETREMAKPDLSKSSLQAVADAYKAAGPSARPGATNSSQPRSFRIGTTVYRGMADLAERNPQMLVRVTSADIVALDSSAQPLPHSRQAGAVGALMAHRTRILNAAGIR
jgi:hypothetical protein